MYQTVGHELMDAIAECMELPLIRRFTKCNAKTKSLCYNKTLGDEVEDLYKLLADVKKRYPQINAVSVGAIFSDYQRNRVENVCSRLGLTPLCFMWRREQRALLSEMISKQMVCVIVKVACLGLNKTHVGKTIQDMESYLLHLNDEYGVHPCGEGGEYETLTLDCPLYKRKRIVLDRIRVFAHSEDEDVISMRMEAFHLEEKKVPTKKILNERIVSLSFLSSINHEEHQETLSSTEKRNIQMSPCTTPGMIIHVELTRAPLRDYESVYDETMALMKSLETKLRDYDCEIKDVIHVRLYVSDMSDFSEINKAFCEAFGGKSATIVSK